MNYCRATAFHLLCVTLCLTLGIGCSTTHTVPGGGAAPSSDEGEFGGGGAAGSGTVDSGTVGSGTVDSGTVGGGTATADASTTAGASAAANRRRSGEPLCPGGDAEVTNGQRRLALIIGVGDYQSPGINDLKGPPNDAQHIYDLLTGLYGFPKNNVCLLTNAQATTAQVLERFESRLVKRAQAKDPVVFYFAGHGSQITDKNGDEPDEFDETLLPQDARMPGVPTLTDDQFNGMLARLYAKSRALTVVVDACNSGSSSRGEAANRWVAPEKTALSREPAPGSTSGALGGGGDGGASWLPVDMPEAVFAAAAADGSSALERDGEGLFTQALLGLLAENPKLPLSWQDVALQLPVRLRAARTDQVPYFSGALNRTVWDSGSSALTGATGRVQDGKLLGWSIQELKGDEIVLKGPPWMAGWSKGALVRVYPREATAEALKEPAQSIAMLEVTRVEGPTAYAKRLERIPGGSGVAPAPTSGRLESGQLAIMSKPGLDALRLTYSIRGEKLLGGVDAVRAKRIRDAIRDDKTVALVVQEKPQQGELELQVGSSGQLQLVNATGRITNTFPQDVAREAPLVVASLWQHARQLALLNMKGDGGSLFTNNSTLKVQVIPASSQPPCAKGSYTQAAANQPQPIPLCHAYQVKVSLSAASPRALLVGGLLLYSDGGLEAFPHGKNLTRLEPGTSVTFPDTFQAMPPLETEEPLLVFGTLEENPVVWGRFASPAVSSVTGEPLHDRSAQGRLALESRLELFLEPGMRGGVRLDDDSADQSTLWTSTFVSTKVEANSRFVAATEEQEGTSTTPSQLMREYTVANFDVRPYLPDAAESGLYRVLMQAEGLAKRAGADGVPYKQHDWSGSTDAVNLSRGIDCSRAIWFAFTRAGLPYTDNDRYVSTREMVGAKGPMSRSFDLCPQEKPLQPGDILVYRDEGRDAGHVVMVIDADKRIAWGSHGWDGNGKEGLAADRGVEYQRIKYKQDWERWDRKTMKRVQCWRHRLLAQEALSPAGQPGIAALKASCELKNCK